MRGFLSKVSDWFRSNASGTDRDYGDMPMQGDVSAAPAESAETALVETMERHAERMDALKEAVEAIKESYDKPGGAAGTLGGFAIGRHPGPSGPLFDSHRIAGVVGSSVFGFLQGVAIRVLARVIAHDGSTARRITDDHRDRGDAAAGDGERPAERPQRATE
jgi:tetrahydromethanopterin S-methyltransferase subunit B